MTYEDEVKRDRRIMRWVGAASGGGMAGAILVSLVLQVIRPANQMMILEAIYGAMLIGAVCGLAWLRWSDRVWIEWMSFRLRNRKHVK